MEPRTYRSRLNSSISHVKSHCNDRQVLVSCGHLEMRDSITQNMDPAELKAKKARLEELELELQFELSEHLPPHLEHPAWYLTGIQVGLASLNSFYAACKTIYQNVSHVDTNASWMANFKFVYEKLREFERLNSGTQRANLMLEVRPGLGNLLADFEERIEEADPLFFNDNLSIVQMVAKDVYLAGNRLRGYDNFIKEINELLKAYGFFKKSQLDAKINMLLASFKSMLEPAGLTDPADLRDKEKVLEKLTHFRNEHEAERRRLLRIRSTIYSGRMEEITDPDDPAADLHPKQVVPYLRKISVHGVKYLERAHSVFQHALERSPDGLALQAQVAALTAELRQLTRANEK